MNNVQIDKLKFSQVIIINKIWNDNSNHIKKLPQYLHMALQAIVIVHITKNYHTSATIMKNVLPRV